MTAPRTTPNPATTTRPERSSKKTASRKSPFAWLPWALLGALALMLLLTFLVINAIDDDGPEGPAGDSLGQVSGNDGDSPVGSDGAGSTDADAGAGAGAGTGAGAAGLQGLAAAALVGGGALPSGPAAEAAGVTAGQSLAAEPGTAGIALFDEASAEITPGAQEIITAAAQSLQEAGVSSVEVIGHTDAIAGEPVNETLSQERADAVAQALSTELPGVEVTTSARGQDEPVASNDTEDGRQLNRRAVIIGRS